MALVAFDFDGTLSDDEMIDLLGEQAGRASEVEAITERAMAGELTYGESLRKRASLLSGLEAAAAERVYAAVELRHGTGDLLRALEAADVPTVILTGGFEPGVEGALERAGASVDRVVANALPVADGRLTGEVEGPLVDGTKGDALRDVAAEFDVPLGETVAVGDGANDLPMLEIAGTAVGVQPKPAVEPHCDVVVPTVEALHRAFGERGIL